MQKNHKKGFTLIEICIYISIFSLVFSSMISLAWIIEEQQSAFSKQTQETASSSVMLLNATNTTSTELNSSMQATIFIAQ
jgi:type II secretory pathway component PulJ